jgi:hypothetical protein
MSSRRAVILMSILLIALTGFISQRLVQRHAVRSYPAALRSPPPLAGKDSISGLEVRQGATGLWMVDFDYFYTGQPAFAELGIQLAPDPDPDSSNGPYGPADIETLIGSAQRGKHHLSAEIHYPSMPRERTLKVGVAMTTASLSKIIARQQIDQVIDWPDYPTWQVDELLAKATPEQNLKRATELIDAANDDGSDPQLQQARAILEKLVEQNPRLDAGYVQLARIALVQNWGPAGFRQATELLKTALQIRPGSADAEILLAHVYSHERRDAAAAALFSAAAATGTNNLFLWVNWGGMLQREHKDDQAIAMYRKVISHPMTHDTYDRARPVAYARLLDLLGQRRDYDAMEPLYKQQIAEFGPGSCYSADYTRFLLQIRGDAQAAIDLARRALNQSCDDSISRQLLGLAEYVKYASATGSTATEALIQAHLFLPAGPKALYLLAQSDRTIPAARRLIATGEKIDEKDNEQLDALAYALEDRDFAAAKRLVKLGADPDAPVGPQRVPVALLPVISGDVAGVRAMRQVGVNYNKIRYRGATAIEVAKRLGDSPLLEALGGAGTGT